MELSIVAPAFVEMAHRIVWCSAATVDTHNRPRSRVLHPIWIWDGDRLEGWIATGPTPLKRAHLAAHPWLSLNYFAHNQDTCVAECAAEWCFDDETRVKVWNLFRNGPQPVGYDPAMIPGWDGPTSDSFAVLRLSPWYLRVFPGKIMMSGDGEILTWKV